MRIAPGFEERIRKLIELAGSQRALARAAGVSDGTVIGWLGGSKPYESTMRRTAINLGVDPEWLVQGEGESPDAVTPRMIDDPEDNRAGSASSFDGPRGSVLQALAKRGKTIAWLGKEIGYDPGSLRYMLEGRGRIKEGMVDKIVRVMPELDREEILGGGDYVKIVSETGVSGTFGASPDIKLPAGIKARYVPLLSMAQAGAFDASHTDDYYDYEGILALNVDDRRAFAIRVAGNSMEPEIKEGDVIICAPGKEPTQGCVAVVRTHSDQAFIKFWKKRGDVVVLESANPAYPPITFPVAEIAGAWPVVQRVSSGMITKP